MKRNETGLLCIIFKKEGMSGWCGEKDLDFEIWTSIHSRAEITDKN
jgi:hypothetical protein